MSASHASRKTAGRCGAPGEVAARYPRSSADGWKRRFGSGHPGRKTNHAAGRMIDMYRTRQSLLVMLGLVLAAPALATAAPLALRVANTGVDGPTCGSAASPCRSITRAIANAATGDTIQVGPGVYGRDLDRDGIDEPGEEAETIFVGKAIKIFSDFGA